MASENPGQRAWRCGCSLDVGQRKGYRSASGRGAWSGGGGVGISTTSEHKGQYISNKEKRCGGGHGRAATRAPSPRPHPPLPLLYGLGGPIRPIVGAGGERMRWVG